MGNFLPAQGPAYSVIGDEVLLGTDIYSLIQLENGDLLLSTNRNLLRFDGYEFHEYQNEKQKNPSLFGLSLGLAESAWCFNLSGQIFKFEEDSLSLYYEIPDSLVSSSIAITPVGVGELIISCKSLFRLTADQELIKIEPDLKNPIDSKVLAIRGSDLVFSTVQSSTSFYMQNGEVKVSKPGELDIETYYTLNYLLYQDGEEYFLQVQGSFLVYKLEHGNWVRFPLEIPEKYKDELPMRLLFLGDGHIGFSLLSGGILQLNRHGDSWEYSENWFENHVISGIIEDREGNWWLGTLGGGLLLVNNPGVEQYRGNEFLQAEKWGAICTDEKDRLFVSSNKGRILSFEGRNKPVFLPTNQSRPILYLDYDAPTDHLLCGTVYPPFQLDLTTGKILSIPLNVTSKANHPYPGPIHILPSSGGVYFWAKETGHFPEPVKRLHGFTFENKNLAFIEGIKRSHWAFYDTTKNELTVGTPIGVRIINEQEIKPMEWKGKTISAKTMVLAQEDLWLASSQLGLLQVREGNVVQNWTVENGLLAGEISKMVSAHGKIFVLFPRQIQILNPETGEFLLIDRSDGLSGEMINGMAINGDDLWVSYDRSLRKVPLKTIRTNSFPPLLRLSDFKVNSSPYMAGNPVHLDNDENHIEFNFLASGFRHQGLMQYCHWLEGADPSWQTQDFSQNWVKYSSLQPGKYTFHLKAINEDGFESEEIIQQFTIAPPFWARGWFIVLTMVTLIAIVVAFFQVRIRSIKKQNAIIREKQRVEMELVDSRITALRSQMNPHFIFNALNSIQEFILLNEKKQASKYLGKFADLMRTYLNHSRQKTVRLSDEISALEIYLELEKLRFEENLETKIVTEPELSPDTIRIPSFIIQPYVENALKHGLLHKRENGNLKVTFGKGDSRNFINCVVEDNGIGREMAGEYRKSRSPAHKPYATDSTRSRLELLSLDKENEAGVEYEDLKDANGAAIGTRVLLRIPIIWV